MQRSEMSRSFEFSSWAERFESKITEGTAGLSCTSLMNLAPPKALPKYQERPASRSLRPGMRVRAMPDLCRMLFHNVS